MEATAAISNSGLGTSDNVIFCVNMDSTNRADLFTRFSNLVYHKNIKPFQALILFFDNISSGILILCYFCPYTDRFYSNAKPIHLEKLFNMHNSLNGKGYNKHVRIEAPVEVPSFDFGDSELSCFNIFTNHKYGRQRLKIAIRQCLALEMLMLSPIQYILNLTITSDLRQFPV